MRVIKIHKNRIQTLLFLNIAKKTEGVTLVGELEFPLTCLQYSTALLVKAISEALKEYPHLNSMVKYASNTKLILLPDIQARLTVSSDELDGRSGVYSYSIHEPDRKNVQAIYQEIKGIKKNLLHNHETYKRIKLLQKLPLAIAKILMWLVLLNPKRQAALFGSFTVTTMGKKSQSLCIPISGSTFTFTMGYPKTIQDSTKEMCRCNLVMVFDHRVLDGMEASEFMNVIKEKFLYFINHLE